MVPFAAPVEDILWSLEHLAGGYELPGWDGETLEAVVRHFASFAEDRIAPLDAPGDARGCALVDGRVRMPDGFAEVYRAYADAGWPGLTAPQEHGGQGQGGLVAGSVSEIFTGACHSLQMVTGLVPGAIRTILAHGTPGQVAEHVPPLVSGAHLATMCLTEPGAGSDLARIRCRAVRKGEGWRIEGEKIFISGGDQDLSDGITHLVLARTSDGGLGGLSLFLCPSRRSDGAMNAVTVTRVEEKLGLHASPTCQMAFDGAEADLLGAEGGGLSAMFTMMNHARLDVALQGVAHAARAHAIARAYAGQRAQGRRADRTPAMIAEHPDVARMMDEIAACAIGGRGLAHLALVALERGDSPDLVEALTPLAKVHCSEAGRRAADVAMQVLGGYGYLREYRLEQVWRDARITAIYEGANGVHARAFALRLLPGAPGAALEAFVRRQCPAGPAERFAAMRAAVAAAEQPEALAHDACALAISTLLDAVWRRAGAAAARHPDPEGIVRLAQRAAARNEARARFRAEMLGL